MSGDATPEDDGNRQAAIVAVLLMLIGATMLAVGISLAFDVPAALIVLGALIGAGGVLLGLTA